MHEQEANDKLEELCGSVDEAFRLSYIWQEYVKTTSGDRYSVSRKPRNIVDMFVRVAGERGYSAPAIKHYVTAIQAARWPRQRKGTPTP